MMLNSGTLEKSRISPSIDEEMLTQLLEKLYGKVNLDFREYKISSVKRRIDRRLRATRSDSYEAYSNFLDLNSNEYGHLLKDLTINVTEFFRDNEPWQILRDRVFPDILSHKKASDNTSGPIRIWSAGCATGQEAYSVAILLNDLLRTLPTPLTMEIYGTDIDTDCLEIARNGQYRPESFAGMDQELVSKYFDEQFRVVPSIKKKVHFLRHDLVLDEPLKQMDLILCRNVAIYFTRSLQTKIFANFYDGLNKNGFLFLGKAESLVGFEREKFNVINKKWKIYEKTDSANN